MKALVTTGPDGPGLALADVPEPTARLRRGSRPADAPRRSTAARCATSPTKSPAPVLGWDVVGTVVAGRRRRLRSRRRHTRRRHRRRGRLGRAGRRPHPRPRRDPGRRLRRGCCRAAHRRPHRVAGSRARRPAARRARAGHRCRRRRRTPCRPAGQPRRRRRHRSRRTPRASRRPRRSSAPPTSSSASTPPPVPSTSSSSRWAATSLRRASEILAPEGVLVTYGRSSGEDGAHRPLLVRRPLRRPRSRDCSSSPRSPAADSAPPSSSACCALIAAGLLDPQVTRTGSWSDPMPLVHAPDRPPGRRQGRPPVD